jgi:hypothetical protein
VRVPCTGPCALHQHPARTAREGAPFNLCMM